MPNGSSFALAAPSPSSVHPPAYSSSGKDFGIRKQQKLLIWKVPDADSERVVMRRITLHRTKKMRVLAFHPYQRIVAAGDVTGRILIWRGFGDRTFTRSNELVNGNLMSNEEETLGVRDDDDADSCTTWHWHPSEVNVLDFSPDGAYLYSGGKEGVLLVWQLDTGKKKYHELDLHFYISHILQILHFPLFLVHCLKSMKA